MYTYFFLKKQIDKRKNIYLIFFNLKYLVDKKNIPIFVVMEKKIFLLV